VTFIAINSLATNCYQGAGRAGEEGDLISCILEDCIILNGCLVTPLALTTLLLQKILSGHNNIVQFVAAAGVPSSKTSHGSAEFLIQTELCTGRDCVPFKCIYILLLWTTGQQLEM